MITWAAPAQTPMGSKAAIQSSPAAGTSWIRAWPKNNPEAEGGVKVNGMPKATVVKFSTGHPVAFPP